jgi:hypothetical protein
MKPNEDTKDKGKVEDESEGVMDKGEGVDVPEEYQQAVHKLTNNATHAHLDHMQNKISARRDVLHSEEKPKKMMSMEGGPSDLD